MARRFAGILVLGLIVAAAAAGRARAADPVDDDGRTWTIGGIKGTADHVADTFNQQTREAWNHLQSAKQAKDHNEWQIKAFAEAAASKVRDTADYKKWIIARDGAKRDLDAARDRSDTAGALDAGSRYNLARTAMSNSEKQAVDADFWVKNERAQTRQFERAVADAEAALKKAATWRSKCLLAFKNRYLPEWPLREGTEVFLDEAIVVRAGRGSVVLGVSAAEPVDYQKNFGGDGIGLITQVAHPVALEIARPGDFTAHADEKLHENRCFVIGRRTSREFVGDDAVPTFAARASDDCPLALMLAKLQDVQGPPREYLAKVDADVRTEVDREIEQYSKRKGGQ